MIATLMMLLASQAFGQTSGEDVEPPAEPQKQLSPEKNTRTEEFLRRLKDDKILERVNYGFSGLGLKVGGLVSGGGFAVGPQYLRTDLKDGRIAVRASAQLSTRNYRKVEAQTRLPRLLDGKAWFEVRATNRDYRSLSYYGPGPDSRKVRADYRLEDTSIDGAFGVSPFRRVSVGGGAGILAVNVGPGKDDRFVSADAIYTPAQAPGIQQQTNFNRFGAFGEYNWTDDPLAPRQGGSYILQYTRFQDRKFGRYDFNLIDLDLQQYVGLFNRTRVIALRAHTRLIDTSGGDTVPFYMQPVIGGSDDLRGFRPFRFSGNNSLALSGEYRWAIFSGCDGAIFVDGGKVFARRGQLNFRDLEGSAGFGLRFNARNRTFMRFDAGFSREGFQVWFKFNDVFQQRPLGTADSQPIL